MISSFIYVSVVTLKQAMEELTAHLKNIGPFEVSVHTRFHHTATVKLKIPQRYNSTMAVINNAFTCAVKVTPPLPASAHWVSS